MTQWSSRGITTNPIIAACQQEHTDWSLTYRVIYMKQTESLRFKLGLWLMKPWVYFTVNKTCQPIIAEAIQPEQNVLYTQPISHPNLKGAYPPELIVNNTETFGK